MNMPTLTPTTKIITTITLIGILTTTTIIGTINANHYQTLYQNSLKKPAQTATLTNTHTHLDDLDQLNKDKLDKLNANYSKIKLSGTDTQEKMLTIQTEYATQMDALLDAVLKMRASKEMFLWEEARKQLDPMFDLEFMLGALTRFDIPNKTVRTSSSDVYVHIEEPQIMVLRVVSVISGEDDNYRVVFNVRVVNGKIRGVDVVSRSRLVVGKRPTK